jgi:hypothetical protein
MVQPQRRLLPRIEVAVPVQVRQDGNRYTCKSVNISQQGMLFVTDVLPLSVGEQVQLQLAMPHEISGQPEIEYIYFARVVHVRSVDSEPKYAVGVRFLWYEDP